MSIQFYEDNKSMKLTKYVMAERCIQAELSKILEENSKGEHSTLTYILEGGFRGFHNMEFDQLVKEYKDIEDYWYQLYHNSSLGWKPYDEDPINFLPEA